MSDTHSSVRTKGEYADKHERHIATKMANMWEEKIGSDMTHSPRTIQDSSPGRKDNKAGAQISLTKAGKASVAAELEKTSMKETQEDVSTEAGSLQKRNTKEIVNSFEKMASLTESGGGVPPKYGKKKSIINPGSALNASNNSRSGDSPPAREDKNELYALIEKLSQEVANMSTTLRALKSKVDGM